MFEVAGQTQPEAPVLAIRMAMSHDRLTRSSVVRSVGGRGKGFEIYQPIVRLDVVSVVDLRVRRDRSVGLLPDVAMLEHSASVGQRQPDVPDFHEASCSTRRRTWPPGLNVVAVLASLMAGTANGGSA